MIGFLFLCFVCSVILFVQHWNDRSVAFLCKGRIYDNDD